MQKQTEFSLIQMLFVHWGVVVVVVVVNFLSNKKDFQNKLNLELKLNRYLGRK